MKPLPALLLNVLVVAVGLFVYDALRAETQPASDGPPPATGDAPAPAPGGLAGSADAMRAHSSEARIRGLETALGTLQAELERLRSGQGADEEEAPAADAPVQIDERTLRWMTAYRQEILKREGEARIRARMAVELERKGVRLPAAQLERVVRETQAFHARAKTLMQNPAFRTAEGREERRRAVRELRDAYEDVLRAIAPAEQVELILRTRMGRAREILPDDED